MVVGFSLDCGENGHNLILLLFALSQIFGHIQSHASPTQRYLVRASYLQIYNETICDLLKPERKNLTIREDKKRGVFVESLSEWVVRSPAEIYGLMERGGAVRATGSTKMNEVRKELRESEDEVQREYDNYELLTLRTF